MGNFIAICSFFIISIFGFPIIGAEIPTQSFHKLENKYTISFGDPKAPIQVTEFFSFTCPKCLEFIHKDFPSIHKTYIDTGKVYWIFHPDPADILTLQTLICLEKLSNAEKQQFAITLFREISPRKGCELMQMIMEGMGNPIPSLHKLDFLEKSQAFQDAFIYLKQEKAPKEIPTIEIDGTVYDAFPTKSFIENILNSTLQGKK